MTIGRRGTPIGCSTSELEQLLGARPIRSHLVHALVQLDRDHTSNDSDEPWPEYYARHLRAQFGAA
jgi:hypothetical protein